MPRLALIPLFLVALAACDDFEGDLKHLTFSTNLRVGLAAWTPAQAVAAGTPIQARAESILGRETQPEHPVVRGSVRGGVARVADDDCEACVRFVGATGARARVGYSMDDVYDEFRVRFEPATSFDLLLGDGSSDDLVLVAGKTIPFGVTVQDARGRALGYDPGQLEVSGTGPVSAWQDEEVLVLVEVDGVPGDQGAVALTYAGKPLGTRAITIVSADDVVRNEKICPPKPEACDSFLVASYTADGRRVLGALDTWEGRPVGPWGEVKAR